MNKYNPNGLLAIEQSFLRVPHEQLKKSYRQSQKHLEKDLGAVSHAMDDLRQRVTAKTVDSDTAQPALDSMLNRLEDLKRKLQDTKTDEEEFIRRSKLRAQHLNALYEISSYESPEYQSWSRTRLSRFLVDYMLRKGYHESAVQLAKTEQIEAFADLELFQQAAQIEKSLAAQSCAECLQWCSDNKVALRKIKSSLEFDLRLQEFIELARRRQIQSAITYVRKHLVPWIDTHAKQVEQAMGLLAFNPKTSCEPYKRLFDPERWQALIQHFREANYALHALPEPAPLHLTLQTGLSAFKTHQCNHQIDTNINCPVCQKETLGKLAQTLPFSHHVNSTLVCRVTGEIMNEDNPPMRLPNGRVYSLKALQELASEHKGKVVCPLTSQVFSMADAKKMYIL
ncbi:GID complex subunit containing RING finger motif [Dimargaris xerosporica]|nr:GID complex subunit containing RING finger motif [Dimargaris xerosporica]